MKKLLIIFSVLLASGVLGLIVLTEEKTCRNITRDGLSILRGKTHKSQFVEKLEQERICYEWLEDKSALHMFLGNARNDPFPHAFILFSEDGKFRGWEFSDAR